MVQGKASSGDEGTNEEAKGDGMCGGCALHACTVAGQSHLSFAAGVLAAAVLHRRGLPSALLGVEQCAATGAIDSMLLGGRGESVGGIGAKGATDQMRSRTQAARLVSESERVQPFF